MLLDERRPGRHRRRRDGALPGPRHRRHDRRRCRTHAAAPGGPAAAWTSVIDWAWVVDHLDELVGRTAQHFFLAACAGRHRLRDLARRCAIWPRAGAGCAPIARDRLGRPVHDPEPRAVRRPRARSPACRIADGARSRSSLYTLLILMRNIVAGLDGVPPDVLEAADAMGYAPRGRLVSVELPLALPLIVAGLRFASVSTIGLVTIVGHPRRPLRRARLLHLRGPPAQLPDRGPVRRGAVDPPGDRRRPRPAGVQRRLTPWAPAGRRTRPRPPPARRDRAGLAAGSGA